jgi:hypothetical protein
MKKKKTRKARVKKHVKLTFLLAPETFELLEAERNGPIFRGLTKASTLATSLLTLSIHARYERNDL